MPTTLNYRDAILNEIKDLSDEQVNTLIKIIRIFKESLVRQRQYDFELKRELEEWDGLSDEAIVNFEQSL
jgi:hypothetical protein